MKVEIQPDNTCYLVQTRKAPDGNPSGAFLLWYSDYFAALAARMASVSMGVTLNRSPQMP